MTDVVPVVGVLAGAIGVADAIPYLRGSTPAAPGDVADLLLAIRRGVGGVTRIELIMIAVREPG